MLRHSDREASRTTKDAPSFLTIDEYHELGTKRRNTFTVFYKILGDHPVRESQPEIPEYLSDDVLLEIPGMPPCVGIEQAAASMDKLATEIPNLVGVTVDIKTIAADGDLVFNERVDYHCDAQGKAHIVVQICSAMEIKNGKIARWKEYLAPRPFLEFVQGK